MRVSTRGHVGNLCPLPSATVATPPATAPPSTMLARGLLLLQQQCWRSPPPPPRWDLGLFVMPFIIVTSPSSHMSPAAATTPRLLLFSSSTKNCHLRLQSLHQHKCGGKGDWIALWFLGIERLVFLIRKINKKIGSVGALLLCLNPLLQRIQKSENGSQFDGVAFI